jgi:hypothetical protein
VVVKNALGASPARRPSQNSKNCYTKHSAKIVALLPRLQYMIVQRREARARSDALITGASIAMTLPTSPRVLRLSMSQLQAHEAL